MHISSDCISMSVIPIKLEGDQLTKISKPSKKVWGSACQVTSMKIHITQGEIKRQILVLTIKQCLFPPPVEVSKTMALSYFHRRSNIFFTI